MEKEYTFRCNALFEFTALREDGQPQSIEGLSSLLRKACSIWNLHYEEELSGPLWKEEQTELEMKLSVQSFFLKKIIKMQR